jgi:hypothetical protein
LLKLGSSLFKSLPARVHPLFPLVEDGEDRADQLAVYNPKRQPKTGHHQEERYVR